MPISAKQKKILTILADGRVHTKTELTANIISDRIIEQQIKALTDLGLEIDIQTDQYQLKSPLKLLSSKEIDHYLDLKIQPLIAEIVICDCLDSTNRYLLDKLQTDPDRGYICLAEYQTAGRGRLGRTWLSPFGNNIYLSILWTFKQGYNSINGLSLAVGVAVVEALQQCGINGLGLKWPNDIYWQDQKLAGILIEVSNKHPDHCVAVIGIGLNLYLPEQQTTCISQKWTDLSRILKQNVASLRNRLVASILNQILPMLGCFEKNKNYYLKKWRQYDCMQGHLVTLYHGKQALTGVVAGIDNQGRLKLCDEQGNIQTFVSGEVSFQN